ncbi:MAG: hypothetical protein IJW46_02070 [Clostridia bacterium]|nr:hypothetical protein [Clostridia bacterium]
MTVTVFSRKAMLSHLATNDLSGCAVIAFHDPATASRPMPPIDYSSTRARVFSLYLSAESMKNQMNLLGLFFEPVMEKAFPKPSTPDPLYREGKKVVKELFERRNQIAHQTDRKHNDATPNAISKEYVEQCFADVSAIANSIQTIAIEKST